MASNKPPTSLKTNAKSPRNAKSRRAGVKAQPQTPVALALSWIKRRETGWLTLHVCLFVLVSTLIGVNVQQVFGPAPINTITEKPIVSRVDFSAIDEEGTRLAREAAKNDVPTVFVPNLEYEKQLRDLFDELYDLINEREIQTITAEERERWRLTDAGLRDLARIASATDGERQWEMLVASFLGQLYRTPILLESESQPGIPTADKKKIMIQPPAFADAPGTELVRFPSAFTSLSNGDRLANEFRRMTSGFGFSLQDAIVATLLNDPQPVFRANLELTEQRRASAYAAESNQQTRQYVKNQVLFPAGEQLDADDLELLKLEARNFALTQASYERLTPVFGVAATMGLFALVIWAYLATYYPRLIHKPLRGLMVSGFVLVSLGAAAYLGPVDARSLYLLGTVFTLILTMSLSLAFGRRLSLAMGVIHAGLVITILGLPIEFGLVMVAGVAVIAWQLNEVRTRSRIIHVGLWAGATMAFALLATGLASRPLFIEGVPRQLMLDIIMAVVSGLFAGLLVQGILPQLEKIFAFNTAMTLRELNDASQPLLQRLAQEAPGTYQHSLRIADMVEAAADSIGADGLLCRVGAMYHDIGKTNKPQYFIENQGGGPNRHNKLSPAMSLLIIVGHVKDGVEMAREYNLPNEIRHFIESHHGTTLVEYFYHAAKKNSEEGDKPMPSEFEYRYPGPKPQTREAAIMLLCDGLEAAARTLPDPTPIRIEQLVHNIAMKRLMDGQFDECNLTLAELNKIEAAITKTLNAIYHARIKYPDGEAKGEKSEKSEKGDKAEKLKPDTFVGDRADANSQTQVINKPDARAS